MKELVKLKEFGSSLAGTKNQPLGDRRVVRAMDPEVSERPRRRKFNAEYKLKILREAERGKEFGQLGALLRREGLYTSNLTTWRRQFERGALAGLAPKKRGKKAKPVDARDTRIRELERDNERLRKRLEQAETIIEVQKKYRSSWGEPLQGRAPRGADGGRQRPCRDHIPPPQRDASGNLLKLALRVCA